MVTSQFPYENRAAVEQAILGELQKILDGKLTAEEVERAKTILLSDVALNDETNSGLAQTLGFYAKVAGDYNFGLTYPDGVRAVTVDDVVNLARKYIDPKKYLELVLVPKGAEAAAAPAVTSTATGTLTTTLDNGLQVILQPDPNTDVVAFHTLVAGGRAAESADQAGITNLTQQLLLRGTKSRTEEQLFGALEDLGAKVGGIRAAGCRRRLPGCHARNLAGGPADLPGRAAQPRPSARTSSTGSRPTRSRTSRPARTTSGR